MVLRGVRFPNRLDQLSRGIRQLEIAFLSPEALTSETEA